MLLQTNGSATMQVQLSSRSDQADRIAHDDARSPLPTAEPFCRTMRWWSEDAVARRRRARAVAEIAAAVSPLLKSKPSGDMLMAAADGADCRNTLTRLERMELVERALLHRLMSAQC